MASVALFTTASNLYNTAELPATTSSTQTGAATKAATDSQEDTVKLSTAAQAKLLYKQGQSVSAIASSLGTTAKEVDDYLGITLEETLAKTLSATLSAKG
jgi:hypothetical protein